MNNSKRLKWVLNLSFTTLAFMACNSDKSKDAKESGMAAFMSATYSQSQQCNKAIKYLYQAACEGQSLHAVCQLYAETMTAFETRPDAPICNVEKVKSSMNNQIKKAQSMKELAPASMKNKPEVLYMVEDNKLRLINGFTNVIIEQNNVKPTQETLAAKVKSSVIELPLGSPVSRPELVN